MCSTSCSKSAMSDDYSQGVARFVDFVDEDLESAARTAQAIARGVPPGGRILDIGAGTGALAVPLARAGYRVTALEPDDGMRSLMMARAQRDPEVDALAARLTMLPLTVDELEAGAHFDRAFSHAVAHLLSPSAFERLLAGAARQLAPGAALLVDIAVDCAGRQPLPMERVAERSFGEARFEHWRELAERAPGQWSTRWVFRVMHGGRLAEEVERRFDWRTDDPERVAHRAGALGLRLRGLWAEFDGTPFVRGDSRSAVLELVRAG